MIIKKMTNTEGKIYTIGFKEIPTSTGSLLECHILKKVLFWHISIFRKSMLKEMQPDYRWIGFNTICDYEENCRQMNELLNADFL